MKPGSGTTATSEHQLIASQHPGFLLKEADFASPLSRGACRLVLVPAQDSGSEKVSGAAFGGRQRWHAGACWQQVRWR